MAEAAEVTAAITALELMALAEPAAARHKARLGQLAAAELAELAARPIQGALAAEIHRWGRAMARAEAAEPEARRI